MLPLVVSYQYSGTNYIDITRNRFYLNGPSKYFQLTMNDFSVHRIIGRGGFGEVYGCRKADTGKMYVYLGLDVDDNFI